jgi:hypothetical protein
VRAQHLEQAVLAALVLRLFCKQLAQQTQQLRLAGRAYQRLLRYQLVRERLQV